MGHLRSSSPSPNLYCCAGGGEIRETGVKRHFPNLGKSRGLIGLSSVCDFNHAEINKTKIPPSFGFPSIFCPSRSENSIPGTPQCISFHCTSGGNMPARKNGEEGTETD